MTLIQTSPKKIYIWDSEVKKVYKGSTEVRPCLPRTFTISRTEQSDMSSWWTYSDDAAWLTAGDGAFDDFFWYSAVLLNTSWVETAEMTQSWWVFTGAMTTLGNITSGDNVMIKFPVRWIKMTKSWSVVTLSITDELDKDGYQYYAFQTWTLSNPWTSNRAFYLWAYKAFSSSNVLKSWSWQRPTVSQRQSTLCAQAKANGTWYNIIWFYQRMYINALYMMKYWNPNSQSVVWTWHTNWRASSSTWRTDSQTNATYWTSNQVKLFWLEDWWWNIYELVWWMYTDWNKQLCTMLSNWSWTVSWWEWTWTTINTTSWYDLYSIAGNNKAMFAPTWTVNNSSYNTYYSDLVIVNASSLATAGGAWSDGAGAGAFQMAVQVTATNSSTYTGSRLMYL